jgi:excisionase family DNA binding protein
VPKPIREAGDAKLAELFDRYGGRMVSPGGAAALLGLTRQTIYTLCKRGELNAYRSDESSGTVPRWVYIPLDDIYAYGERVGRPLPRRS